MEASENDVNQLELDTRAVASLSLAYIGDAVYDLEVREYLIKKGINKVQLLHKQATKFVSAAAQAEILFSLIEHLDEQELAVVKRGRNAKSNNSSKNASSDQYRYSTAFESLIGYLYLNKQQARLQWLIDSSIKYIEGVSEQ